MPVKMFTVLNQGGKTLVGHLAEVLNGHSIVFKYSGHYPFESCTAINQPHCLTMLDPRSLEETQKKIDGFVVKTLFYVNRKSNSCHVFHCSLSDGQITGGFVHLDYEDRGGQ